MQGTVFLQLLSRPSQAEAGSTACLPVASLDQFVREGFAILEKHLTAGTPKGDEGTIKASADAMTEDEAISFSKLIVEMYEYLMLGS